MLACWPTFTARFVPGQAARNCSSNRRNACGYGGLDVQLDEGVRPIERSARIRWRSDLGKQDGCPALRVLDVLALQIGAGLGAPGLAIGSDKSTSWDHRRPGQDELRVRESCSGTLRPKWLLHC